MIVRSLPYDISVLILKCISLKAFLCLYFSYIFHSSYCFCFLKDTK